MRSTLTEIMRRGARLDALSWKFEEGIPPPGSTRTHYVDQGEEDFVQEKDGVWARP